MLFLVGILMFVQHNRASVVVGTSENDCNNSSIGVCDFISSWRMEDLIGNLRRK